MKIIVVGAGIAGLTFGLACHARGMQVKIVDKAKALQSIGGGIFLWPHAVRYLQELGLYESIQTECMAAQATNLFGHRGNLLLRDSLLEIYKLIDGEILTLDRSAMQQCFISLLPAGMLTLDKACVGIENKSDYARIFFADGTEETADLIIGADGVHSAVRQSLFPEREAAYSGFCWWGGMVDRKYVPHYVRDEARFTVGQDQLCSVWPIKGERFMWYLPVKMPLTQYIPEHGQTQVEAYCQQWPDDILRLVSSPQSAQHFYVPIYEVEPAKKITHGRTALIGDAACTIGPLLGLGVNKAIEDAYILAMPLQNNSSSLTAKLNHYQQLRWQRHQRFNELEHMSAESLMQSSSEALRQFEAALPHATITMMYQDMIPLVNSAATAEVMNLSKIKPPTILSTKQAEIV